MTCLLGADIDFVYRKKKGNHHENEAEHPTIEKYLRTLMAKKLHGALLVPQKVRTKAGKKRTFKGNQHQVVVDKINDVASSSSCNVDQTDRDISSPAQTPTHRHDESASSSKLERIDTNTPKQSDINITGYRFIDVEILTDVFALLCCPECKTNSSLKLHENFMMKKGLASMLELKCNKCGYKSKFYTSKQCDRSFDINRRIVYSMRSCGQGHSSIQKFTTLMNMPMPMTQKSYNATVKRITETVTEVAKETMSDGANAIKCDKNNLTDTSVSVDGSWQRRGYSSFNGVVTAISVENGKILDVEPMSRMCKECKLKENLKNTNPDLYGEWRATHDCKLNYQGSAGGMEVTGAKRIFGRSVEKHNLRYTKFLGDGDSKSFPAVKSIYPDIEVKKLECVGHVQKRVGTRLRNLKKKCERSWR